MFASSPRYLTTGQCFTMTIWYRICQNNHQQYACGPTIVENKSGVELERESIWVLGWSLISLILRESVYHLVWVPFPWQYGLQTRERFVFSWFGYPSCIRDSHYIIVHDIIVITCSQAAIVQVVNHKILHVNHKIVHVSLVTEVGVLVSDGSLGFGDIYCSSQSNIHPSHTYETHVLLVLCSVSCMCMCFESFTQRFRRWLITPQGTPNIDLVCRTNVCVCVLGGGGGGGGGGVVYTKSTALPTLLLCRRGSPLVLRLQENM